MRLIKDAQETGSQWESWTVADVKPEDFGPPSSALEHFLARAIDRGQLHSNSTEELLHRITQYWVEKTRT